MTSKKVPIDVLMDRVEWIAGEPFVPRPDDPPEIANLPHVTHEGVLRIAGMEIPVVQLSDGQRLITEEGMQNFYRWLDSGGGE